MRNLTFHGVHTAINQIWDWGWTYHGINIYNSSIGLDMSSGGTGGQSVGSVTFIDSSMTDTKVGILTAHTTGSDNQPPTAGSLIVENVQLNNVPVAIQGPNGVTYLAGTTGSMTIPAWGQGHSYTPKGPNNFQGPIQPFPRPGSLLVGAGRFYARSKPQYATTPVSQFSSVRDGGAKGDGITDDTAALNKVISSAAESGKIVFFDAGTYKVTSTINVPAGSKIVGESYSVIMGSGAFFSDMKKPQPMVQVGKNGEEGTVEWSDMIVATQGPTAGAILIEWNLASPTNNPSGMWDVHSRIGGFAGSSKYLFKVQDIFKPLTTNVDLQLANCPKTPAQSNVVNPNCIAAFMTMHVTKSGRGLYLENVWLWTADHDMDDPGLQQITIFTGRGLYVESDEGELWL
jgi:glucan 1,3-beta-glucosidase